MNNIKLREITIDEIVSKKEGLGKYGWWYGSVNGKDCQIATLIGGEKGFIYMYNIYSFDGKLWTADYT